MFKAWLIGTCIMIALYLMRFATSIANIPSELLGDLVLFAPGVVGFLVARRSPNKKILLASSMGLTALLLFFVLNSLDQAGGIRMSFPNYPGDPLVYTLMFFVSTAFAAIGGVVGYFFTERKSKTAVVEREEEGGDAIIPNRIDV
jgi:hypothetical protein